LTTLTSKEIERRRILVSKFKEDAINHIEIQVDALKEHGGSENKDKELQNKGL
jgi:hypothetical protein